MRFYLKQVQEPNGILFRVYDEPGETAFSVTGGAGSLGGKIFLWNSAGEEVARILRLGVPALSQYSISIGGRERLKVTCNLAPSNPRIRLGGTGWRLRGDVLLRSFDIVDVDRALVMSHGRCWSTMGDCFGLEIVRQRDIPACIAVAVIIDSHIIGTAGTILPVG